MTSSAGQTGSPNGILDQTTLYYQAGSSDKVYQVMLIDAGAGLARVDFAFGRRTGTLNASTKTKSPVPLDDAKRIFAKLVSEKTAKGYKPGANGASVEAPTASAPGEEAKDVACQLLTSIDNGEAAAKLLLDPNYAAQQKFDGKRIVLHVEGKTITGYNRSGKACGVSSEIIAAARRFSETGPILFDGETIGDTYHVFDILEIGGVDIRKWRFDQREAQLQAVTASRKCAAIIPATTEFTQAGKVALLEDVHARQLEGIVLKRVDTPYLPGRQRDQFKHKLVTSASFVVLKLNEQNSVQIGTFDDQGNMVENGNVTIRNQMFKFTLKVGSVVEVRYLYAFPDSNHVYQPRMLMTRDDIRPEDCKLSQLKYKGAQ